MRASFLKQGGIRQFTQDNPPRRFVFYFVEGDDARLEKELDIPDPAEPDIAIDLQIKRCGKRLVPLEKPRKWAEENDAPQYVMDCLYRSEKAVDTQICCDAFELAVHGKLDRLFLYSNDSDFVPLCKALQRMGTNVHIVRLSATLKGRGINKELADAADGVTVLTNQSLLYCFSIGHG